MGGATAGQAQGVYVGNFSSAAFPNGYFNTLVLDDDEVWALYGVQGTAGELIVYGLTQGQGVANNGSFTAPSVIDYSASGTTLSGSLTGSYVPGVRFNATLTSGGQSINIYGTPPAPGTTSYVYNTPASLADVLGTWNATSLDGLAMTFTVASTGSFSGMGVNGCSFSGSITPRSSGKNVFNVTVSYPNSLPCGTLSGQAGRGVALSTLLTSGRRQLIVAAVTNDRQYGSAVLATR